MWVTAEDHGLTLDEIDEIAEKLWKEETEAQETKTCHDCGVKLGEHHQPFCDLGHCMNCGEQTIFMDCCENPVPDKWSGLWPGIETAYKYKVICYWSLDAEPQWRFDLNRAALYTN